MRTTIADIDRLIDAIQWGDSHANHQIERTLAHMLRSTVIEDGTKQDIDQDEHDPCTITVIRDADDLVRWIIEDDGNGTNLWRDPRDWAEQVSRHAAEHGWDADEEPAIPTASDRAGVHAATGIPYAASRKQMIQADAELALMRLYREVMGLPVSAAK